MTDKEAMKLVKILENIEDYRITMTAAHEIRRLHFENKELKERLADPMREVQRLGQEIEQDPICPACKAEVLYECVACSSNNYPPQEKT